jgi:hypothetical protein
LRAGAKAILHIVPLEAFTTERDIGINPHRDLLQPIGSMTGLSTTHTLEGYATYSGRDDIDGGAFNYALLFRSGIIESGSTVGYLNNGVPFIPSSAVEWRVLEALSGYRKKLIEKGIGLPFYVFLSIINARGHQFIHERYGFFTNRSLRSDALLLPEAIITDAQQCDEEVLRPVFDRLWNAFGYERSMSFDAANKYIGDRG